MAISIRLMRLPARAPFIFYPPLCCKDPTCTHGQALPCQSRLPSFHLHLISCISCILVASFQSKGTVASVVPVETFRVSFLRCFFCCMVPLLSTRSTGIPSPLSVLPRSPPDPEHLLCPAAHCSSHIRLSPVVRLCSQKVAQKDLVVNLIEVKKL